MAIGATNGVTYAVERMSRSNGGSGGRIITTASSAGLIVRVTSLIKRGQRLKRMFMIIEISHEWN